MNKPLKTEEITGSVVQQALNGVTVVTANRHAARELLLSCERELKSKGRSAWQTPRVISWSGWIESLWTDAALLLAQPPALLNSAQELALWKSVISKLRPRGFLDLDGAAALCAGAWELIHQYRVPRERNAFQVSAETRLFFECAERYLQVTQQNCWTDSARLPDQVMATLDASRSPREIIFFGFDVMTPQQSEYRDLLQASGVRIQERKSEAERVGLAVKIGYPTVEDELRAAAHWASARLEESPGARIGIVVPQLQQVLREAEHTLAEVFYPGRSARQAPLAGAYHVSLGPALNEYPLVRAALTALRWIAGPLPMNEIGYLLRSPYFAASHRDQDARAMLELELRRLRPRLSLKQLEDLLKTSPPACKDPGLARAVRSSRGLCERLQGRRASPSSWAEEFSNALKLWGWPGEAPDSHEYQTAEKLRELLNQFATLDVVSGPMSLEEAVEALVHMVSGVRFRPENEGAAVYVAGVLEMAGCCFDHLWITGMSDAGWPMRGYAHPLLPFELQRQYQLPNCSPEQQLAFAQRLFDRLLHSGAETVVSWPQSEGEETLGPSAWLSLPDAKAEELIPPQEPWPEVRRSHAEMEEFIDEHAPVLSPGPRRGGTRLLELQSACPFRAVAEIRLGAKPNDEAGLGLDSRRRGELVEVALRHAWEQFRDKQNYLSLTDSDRTRVFEQSADVAMAKAPAPDDEWQRRHLELERERLLGVLREWFAVDTSRREPFWVVGHQREVGLNFAGLELRGKIDRVDRLGDGTLVILDYKTGGKESAGNWNGPRPEKPQLPAYVVAQNPVEVSAVAFAQVRARECKFKGYAERQEILSISPYQPRDKRSFAEHKAAWVEVLDGLARQFLEGRAEVDPKKPPLTCKFCHLPDLCRIAESQPGFEDEATIVEDAEESSDE